MQIKFVFVDIDNTLLSFDEYVKHTMQKGFSHFGIKKYEPYMYDVFHEENNALWRKIEQGTITFHELEKVRWNNVFTRLKIDFDGPKFEKYFRAELYNSAIPEAEAFLMLDYLSKKYTLCVASNGPFLQQLHRIEIAEMKKYFDYFFISEKVGASKPSKEFFEYAFREINDGSDIPVSPCETIIIGDSLTSDIAGGRQFGMKTCYYTRGKECDEKPADIVIDRLSDIKKYL